MSMQRELLRLLLFLAAIIVILSPSYINLMLSRLGIELGAWIFVLAAFMVALGLMIFKFTLKEK